MDKKIVNMVDLSRIEKGKIQIPEFFLCADLYAKNLNIIWNDDEKNAEVTIVNRGYMNSGSFMVYFDLEEEPMSRNHRPQVRVWIDNLSPHSEVIKSVDFIHLRHPDNNNLGNVYKIVVQVDPKNMVDECNENNNHKEKNLQEYHKAVDKTYDKLYIVDKGKEFDKLEIVDKSPKEFDKSHVGDKSPKEIKEKDKDLVETAPGNIHLDYQFERISNRLEAIEKQLATGKSFISEDERPDVGNDLLNKK